MKLLRNAFAACLVAAVAVAACSSRHGSTTGAPDIHRPIEVNDPTRGATGSLGMHLTIGNGVHVNELTWTISNGANTYSGTVFITDDAGHEAQSVEFVAGGIQASGGYIVTLSGADTSGDPCSGSSQPVNVVAGVTSVAQVLVTCSVPTDASLATPVNNGNLAVEAGVILVNQAPFVCPGITGVSISPAELLSPETAALSAGVTGSSGGTPTLQWTTSCSGAEITPANAANATFLCGSTPPGTQCTVTLTVGLNGTGADGGSVGQVCTGVVNTTTTESITCETGCLLACFAPTPNVCSFPCQCVNLQTDPKNCGSCGNVCPLLGCCNGVCTSDAPLTACTSAPCSSCGANSVQCPNSPTGNGVCTPTEATIVQKDIAAANLTNGQLNPFVSATNTGSCYSCLNAKACLDDNAMDTGNECSDVPADAGANGLTECMTTLNCIIQTDCQGPGGILGTDAGTSQENVNLCYCGGDHPGSACSASGLVPDGQCDTQEAAGLGFPVSDNTDILLNFGSKTLPSGIANHIFQCAASNKCTLCL
jgi:hypothetical protein